MRDPLNLFRAIFEPLFLAPIECYIMQGDNPLSDSVIQKFAKTGGELCKNVFLMSKCCWLQIQPISDAFR